MARLNVTRRDAALLMAGAALSCATAPAAQAQARDVMRRATRFMTEQVAHQGGYVWSYLPDFSRRWGEMEAFPTMQWVQPPGTATMGHLFLDAFAATNDDLYLTAARNAGAALIAGRIRAAAGTT